MDNRKGSFKMSWHPVTRNNPCLVCNKSKAGYCMFSDNGEFLCMRVESRRPIKLKSGEVGWIHFPDGSVPKPVIPKERPPPVINVGKLMRQWHEETDSAAIEQLADELGVRPFALHQLGCVWAEDHRAWAFPMSDGYGNLTGIRLRTDDGHKFAVRGSHQGVFLPISPSEELALVCEGPTDTAAALSLGFYAVGRPSCSGGMADIVTAFRRLKVSRAVIVADSDEVGSRGAAMLQKQLPMPSALIVLPAKDLRKFVELGGTRELIDSMINNLIWETK